MVLVSVVVASRNRPQLLRRMLATLMPQLQALGAEFEVIIVDDGSSPPYPQELALGARFIRTGGVGPARARNAGVAAATGEIIAFTDDDVIVEPGWLNALIAYLRAHPDHAGVTGDTSSPKYDPVFEHSVEDHVGGSFLTCNVAYRHSALVTVGGFDELFTHAHEDRDLAWRIEAEVGPVGVEATMKVTHPGREFTVASAVSRAKFIFDDWLLFARYPDRRAGDRSIRWTPVFNSLRTWRNVLVNEGPWRSPRRLARFSVIAVAQVSYAMWLAMTRWSSLRDRDVRPVPGLRARRPRLAYVGPSPDPRAGGAPGVAGLLLTELLDRGYDIDCFVAASREDDDPRGLGERPGLSYVIGQSRFAFGQWYSRHRLTKMVSSQAFAAANRRKLARRLGAMHRASPYAFAYQFSTFESFGVPRIADLPVLIHPSVHAAGERRWVRREAGLEFSDDGSLRRSVVVAWLSLRAARQRRDARRATGILALSRAFGDEIIADYGVDPSKVRIVPNCVDVAALSPAEPANEDLLVVGRLVVRKGLEDVVALSHRLGEVGGPVRLRILGSPSLWSDYSRLIRGVDAARTTIEGPRTRAEVFAAVSGSLALLQLSRYEPFGLTVAEALALGVPVVVTAAVGAAELVADDVKLLVEPGDIDALVEAVSSLVALRDDERSLLSHRCRREAERLFSPRVVCDALETAIDELTTKVS